jgi:hypothetical protein
MNFPPAVRRLLIVTASFLALSTLARAQETKPAAPAPAYPLTTCIVADEKLGEMGKPYDYVHKEDGKPDRLVRFCCKGCLPDFKKDPAKYLKRLDEAEAKAAAATKKS